MKFQDVPSQFDFPASEREILKFWESAQIYEKSLSQREDAPPFVFYEGPPTANGLPHPGHCLTRVIKDCFPRYKTMTGHLCHRKGGWDTHGLPVETEVCKELGIHTKEEIEQYGIEKFNRLCQESVFRYTKEWEELTRRLGFWIHLDEAYVTYHQSYVESVWWALSTMFKKGLLYQGHKVVWWWPQGGTALSAGEVGQGYREVDDPSITVRFRVPGTSKLSLLAWTTTPWTLPSNVALAVHPEYEYIHIAVEDEEFILAKDLLQEVFKGLPIDLHDDVKTVRTLKGSELVGMKYEPLFRYAEPEGGKSWEVIAADFVTLDTGTGIVHVAPAFGEDDYKIAQEAGLGFLQLIAPDGTFVPEATDFAGRFCKEADSDIIKMLKENGSLLKREQVRHDYPFCWRAENDPLIQYARDSWFIRTTKFRDRFLTNNNEINWLPKHIGERRFGNFLEGNVDWALSRERFWGTPLPIWVCEKTGKQEAISSYDELLAKPEMQGDEVFKQKKKEDPELSEDLKVHKPYIDAVTYASPFAPDARMRRVSEVIDVWFDSGCMPFAQWGYPQKNVETFQNHFPADFISEALDQTRGWFYTLLAISTVLFSEESDGKDGTFAKPYAHPFRNCIVLGLMAGEDGKKLSKSKRNYRDPTYIFDREGADAMRWSMLSGQAPWTSVRFKEDTIATDQREFLIKLYNVYSFFVIYANIDGWSPSAAADSTDPMAQSELDRWITSELNQTTVDVRRAMDGYENYPACRSLTSFVDALSNWYVRRSRERFWRTGMDPDKRAAYHTLWNCLETISKLMAPFTPFLAESLYQNLVRTQFPDSPESVHLCDYPTADEAAIDRSLMQEMAIVREITSLGRAARTGAGIKVRQPLSVVEVMLADQSHQSWLESHLGLITEELNVKKIEFLTDADKYVTYQITPDFKKIGPRFGKLVPQIKKTLATADAVSLRAQLEDGGTATLDVNGEKVELSNEDVKVSLQAKEGWSAEQGRDVVVVLSTEITDELKIEGVARDLIHLIQNARKKESLEYQARIRVRFTAAVPGSDPVSDPVSVAIDAWGDYIRQETLADELTIDDSLSDTVHGGEIEGVPVGLAVNVVG